MNKVLVAIWSGIVFCLAVWTLVVCSIHGETAAMVVLTCALAVVFLFLHATSADETKEGKELSLVVESLQRDLARIHSNHVQMIESVNEAKAAAQEAVAKADKASSKAGAAAVGIGLSGRT